MLKSLFKPAPAQQALSDDALRVSHWTPEGYFDEWRYLTYNPDVAEQVRLGNLANGEAHFAACGAEEILAGRRPMMPSVREHSYLLRNPDVAEQVRSGEYASGQAFWEARGRAEEETGARLPYVSNAARADRATLSTWKDGYLHLRNVFSEDECDAVNAAVEKLVHDRHRHGMAVEVDVDLDSPNERKVPMAEVSDAQLDHPLKINTLYYWLPEIRNLVLDDRVTRVLRTLLDGDPTALTSLNFIKGSQQGFHLDTFYMPPVIPHRMVASWIALEDVTPDNGPLQYVPGSNRIEPYMFDGHTMRVLKPDADYTEFGAYYGQKMQDYDLKPQQLSAKKGDVFIWHGLLYHGGAPILDAALTRKSVVAHFFAAADYPGGTCTGTTDIVMHREGAYFENRPSLVQPRITGAQLSFGDVTA